MSIFLTVLLKILIIIGIIILSVIGFALFLLALVLFVPIRYKLSGYYNNESYNVNANVNWLLHILHITFELNPDKALIIRVFGFKLPNSKKSEDIKNKKIDKKSKNKNKLNNKDTVKLEKYGIDNEDTAVSSINNCDDDVAVDIKDNLELTDTAIETDGSIEDTVYDENTNLDKKISDSVDKKFVDDNDDKTPNIEENKKHFKRRKKDEKDNSSKESIYDKINYYKSIIQSKRFEKAFELCKKELIRLIKLILPRKWNAKIDLILSDPSQCGSVWAYYGALFPLLYNNTAFNCSYGDEDYKDIQLKAQGRIYICVLVYIFIKVFFNKNIRKIIKLFKREEK